MPFFFFYQSQEGVGMYKNCGLMWQTVLLLLCSFPAGVGFEKILKLF